MSKLFLGQNGTGKTKNIQSYVKFLKGRRIILDFSNEYENLTENVFYLDEINLLESDLSYTEMQAINAGYLLDSHCLYRRSIDLIMESDTYTALKTQYEDTEDEQFKQAVFQIKVPHLIENTLERLHISWNRVESEYAKILNDKIPKKRSKNHISLDEAVNKVLKHDIIRLQTKTMQSEHQRAVTFCLLTRLSYLLDEPVHIIADDMSAFFNNGNTKLFLSAAKSENLSFVCAFNKPSVLPKALMPFFDEIFFHKIDNNASIKELVNMFNWSPKFKLVSTMRNLKLGKYERYSLRENKTLQKTT